MTSARGPVLALPHVAPGSSARRSVTVTNSGTAPGHFALEATTTGSPRLARALRVTISVARAGQTEPERIFAGTLARLRQVPLGTLAVGESAVVRFHIQLPRTGLGVSANVLAGLTTDTMLTWCATQV
jgi:hypothetical protein